MRSIDKLVPPTLLVQNQDSWTSEYKLDRTNTTKRYRYRNKEIKTKLKEETSNKCVYCESKIGHNTPGDIEHKIPSSKCIDLHFAWDNLTIACTECNRRKNDYYKVGNEFLDPYVDDVEKLLEHLGPVCFWKNSHARAEITIKILELNSSKRNDLIIDKIGKLEEVQNLYERYQSEENPTLKAILLQQLIEMGEKSNEYSGMICSVLKKRGLGE